MWIFQGCLFFAKSAILVRLVLLAFIQTRKSYELIWIDLISPFKKSVYSNSYIYNLIDNLLRHMYPHMTYKTCTNNVIILFNHYLVAYFKPYTVYIDVGLYFTSQKL